MKVTCAFLLLNNNSESIRIKHFKSETRRYFHIFDEMKVPCKSTIT